MRIAAIAAMNQARVIGSQGRLLWHLPGDLKRFKELTTGGLVLMGRKTYASLPARSRPLPGRRNIVVTRTPAHLTVPYGVEVWTDVANCIDFYRGNAAFAPKERLWVIGGGEIYAATQPLWDEVFLTLVSSAESGDAFFPEFESSFAIQSQEEGAGYAFLHYSRRSLT